ncbi:MAG: LuxR C-terminal-related transcriptional regulator [Nitrospirota bacterium]
MADELKQITRTADGVFAIDPEGRIILWNPSAQKILEYTPEDVLGKHCYEALPGRDSAGNLFCFKGCSVVVMACQGRLIRNYDVQLVTKTGRKVCLNVSILILSPKRNGPIIVHFFRPVPGLQRPESLVEQVTASVLAVLKGCNGAPEPAADLSVSGASSPLTRRETEILMLIARCLGAKEISDRLGISHATVRTHIQNILQKLQVHSKLEAVSLAFRQNLIPIQSSGPTARFPHPLQQLQ